MKGNMEAAGGFVTSNIAKKKEKKRVANGQVGICLNAAGFDAKASFTAKVIRRSEFRLSKRSGT